MCAEHWDLKWNYLQTISPLIWIPLEVICSMYQLNIKHWGVADEHSWCSLLLDKNIKRKLSSWEEELKIYFYSMKLNFKADYCRIKWGK